MWYITSVLILAGIITLAFSLRLASRIIAELKNGTLNKRWILLRILIFIFIAGYLAYWGFISHDDGIESLIVGGVFLLGALFVFLVCWIMLQTVRDIKRVAALEKENITDPLLDIYNRRYLEERLKEEVARTQRYKSPLSLLMIDIDHFKRINDHYGHQIGDAVLIGMGKILKAQTRKSDLAARYGGEEMVVLLPNTEEEEAFLMAERIRQTIQQATFADTNKHNGSVQCTVSVGVSSLTGDSYEDADLLRKTDVALYQAKQTGRNRSVIYKAEHEKNTIA